MLAELVDHSLVVGRMPSGGATACETIRQFAQAQLR